MLSKDFKEFVALLNAHEAEYLVVGGYAMAVHGRPRQTGEFRIDLLTAIDGVGFDTAWPSRFEYRLGEQTVPFIGLDALKQNKRASGRPRDIDDLENLP